MIEDVRELSPVGEWYKPPSRSSLMKLTKADLIEYLAVAFRNWHIAEEQKVNIRNYFKGKEEVDLT